MSPWYCKIFDYQGVLDLRLGLSNIIGKTPRSTKSIEYFVAVEIHNTDSLICWRLRFEILEMKANIIENFVSRALLGLILGIRVRGEAPLTEPIFDLPSNYISFERS